MILRFNKEPKYIMLDGVHAEANLDDFESCCLQKCVKFVDCALTASTHGQHVQVHLNGHIMLSGLNADLKFNLLQ